MAKLLETGDVVQSADHVYKVESYVGSGGQAHGYRVRCADLADGPVFLKQYHEGPFVPRSDVGGAVRRMQAELVRRLEAFSFVQRIHEFFEHESCYYQSGAWQEGVSLSDRLEAASSYAARERKLHAATLCYAVSVLHDAQKIAHMDISRMNVRVVAGHGGNDRIHLTDFDNATIDGCQPVVVAGTPGYIAPEKIDAAKVGFKGTIGYPSDVFSLACLLYQIYLGVLPWCKENEENGLLYLRTHDAAWHPARLSHFFGDKGPAVGRRLGDVLWACLAPAAQDRPTAHELHGAVAAVDIEDDTLFPVVDDQAPNLPLPAAVGPAPAAPPPVKEAVAPAPAPVERHELVLRCGDRRIVMGDTEIVGRDALRGLENYQTVSSRHARFFFIDGVGWFVSHVGTSNPTVVDGVEVAPLARRALKAGACVRLGTLELVVESA